MALKHFTAAYLQYTGSSSAFLLQKPAEEPALDGRAEYLLRELKQAFIGKAGKIHGEFSSDISEAPIKPWLQQLLDKQLGFESFSQKLWQHLETSLAGSSVDVDGHVLIFIEALADGDFLHLFIVDHKEGLYLDSQLQLSDSLFLDLSKIVVAARINISQACGIETLATTEDDSEAEAEADDSEELISPQGNHASYLSVLKARGDKELTDFFTAWVGVGEPVDTAADTDNFLEAVAEFTKDMDDVQASLCRNEVVEYCVQQDKLGESVQIKELSSALSEQKIVEEEDSFSQFVSQYQGQRDMAKSDVLIPDRSKLRQFLRISGRSDNLSMSFNADCLGDTVVYNPQSDSLTITSIPSALKLRLLKHMQEDTSS